MIDLIVYLGPGAILVVLFFSWIGYLAVKYNLEDHTPSPAMPILNEPLDFNNPAHAQYARDCIAVMNAPNFNHRNCPNFGEWHTFIKGDGTSLMKLAAMQTDQEILDAKRNAYMRGEVFNKAI